MMEVSIDGPCLWCGRRITYGVLNQWHYAKGDEWLYSRPRFNDALQPGGRWYRRTAICPHWYQQYLCYDCNNARHDANHTLREIYEVSLRHPRRSERSCNTSSRWVDFEALRREAYQQFLQSEYWAEVRRLKLRECGACEICGAELQRLHIHHKSYAHHGIEHRYLDELQVLCEDCHKRQHGG